jgi:hypothetical protein
VKYGYVLFAGYSKTTSGAPSYVGQEIIGGYWANGTSAFNKSFGLPGFVDDFHRGIAAGRNCMYVVGGYSQDQPYYKISNTRIYKYSAITHYPDMSYVGGSTGHQLSWTLYTGAGSLTSRDYSIYYNGTLNHTAQWTASPSGFPISVNIDGLPVGKNNVTIVAGLIDGDVVQDTTYVTVTNVLPVITMPATAAIELTTLGNNLSSTITDLSTGATNYWLFQNGSLNQTDSWVHNVPIEWEVDGLAEGIYNFTIVVNDGYGLNVSGTTILTVFNLAPVITMPATAAIELTTLGNNLSSTITDLSTGATNYWLFQNGSLNQTDSWVHNVPIEWEVDGLAEGIYNFTIVVNDGYGLNVSGTSILTVFNLAPVITIPATAAIDGNTGGNVLSCTIADQSIGATTIYVVYRNGIPVQSGFWVPNIPVVWDADGLAAGSYNFTIVATDGLGLTGRGTTIATVSVTQPGGGCDPALGVATLTLAIITLGVVAAHFGWHLYRKYIPERKSKGRT